MRPQQQNLRPVFVVVFQGVWWALKLVVFLVLELFFVFELDPDLVRKLLDAEPCFS
jgi:hypothetical protein